MDPGNELIFPGISCEGSPSGSCRDHPSLSTPSPQVSAKQVQASFSFLTPSVSMLVVKALASHDSIAPTIRLFRCLGQKAIMHPPPPAPVSFAPYPPAARAASTRREIWG